MNEKVPALSMRKNFGRVLDRVAKKGEHITITRGGKSLVTLIPAKEYEQIFSKKGRLEGLHEALSRLENWQRENARKLKSIGRKASAENEVRTMREERCWS